MTKYQKIAVLSLVAGSILCANAGFRQRGLSRLTVDLLEKRGSGGDLRMALSTGSHSGGAESGNGYGNGHDRRMGRSLH